MSDTVDKLRENRDALEDIADSDLNAAPIAEALLRIAEDNDNKS
jgi:hypothetical protein